MSDWNNAETEDGQTRPAADRQDNAEPLTLVAEAERYREEGMLGRGGMGVVTTQFDRRIGRHVACKDLRQDVAHDNALRTRFLREARVQGRSEEHTSELQSP